MGQTGAGIDREDEIDMSQDNEFFVFVLAAVEKIKQEFPWFWDMKTLVQDRPNRIRTGLGNGETEIDFSAIMPGARLEREESEAPSGAADTMHNGHDSDMSLDIGQEVVDSDEDCPHAQRIALLGSHVERSATRLGDFRDNDRRLQRRFDCVVRQ
ncbi:hypothetical protein BC629DRAFT_919851 [Irpex lacteus]|nr:hypothetical protein BC629DRAFT_919851 [Irpex lacteus]